MAAVCFTERAGRPHNLIHECSSLHPSSIAELHTTEPSRQQGTTTEPTRKARQAGTSPMQLLGTVTAGWPGLRWTSKTSGMGSGALSGPGKASLSELLLEV